MLERNQLMLYCAAGALILSAGVAAGQSQTPPAANDQQAHSTAATTDAERRANETKQNTGAASANAIETVEVTATRRESSIQNLAVAVSAYTDERRNLVGIETESDIVNFTPSMSLNGEFLSLRGVGRYTDTLGTDAGVAILVDGIYTPSPDYLNVTDFFTDRVEILRGPQGTLGGQNDIGGTVNLVEKRPTDEFHEEFRIGYNNYNLLYADASISGPITDNLKFRLADAVTYQPSWDGYVKNLASKIYPNSGTTNFLEGQLEWTPFSNLDVWLKVQNFAENIAAPYGLYPGPSTAGFMPSGFPIFPPGTPGFANCPTQNGVDFNCLAPAPADLLGNPPNPGAKRFVVDDNPTGYVKERNDWTYTTQVNWDLPGVNVEYIGGWSQYDYLYDSDFGNVPPLPAVDGFPANFLEQTVTGYQAEYWYQNELDIKSTDDGRLKWNAGVFQYSNYYYAPYYEEEPNNPGLATPVQSTPGLPDPANPTRSFYSQIAKLQTNAQSVYFNLDYALTDTVRLTGGLRYNWDQKHGFINYNEIFDEPGIFFDPALSGLYVANTPANVSSRISSSDWTGKIGTEWRPDDTTLAYVSVAKGYKASGMSLLDISPTPTVRPETLYDFEGGVKKTLWDQLVVNADVYYYDYQNLQQLLTVLVNDIETSELVSGQRARTYGFELESVWSPTEDFSTTFNYSYMNARFTQFSQAGGFADISQLAPGCIGNGASFPVGACLPVVHPNLNGNTIPQSPTNKVTINPVYTMHFPFGDVTGSATYAFIDSQYYSIFNNSGFLAPSYYNLDLRLLYQPPGGSWTFILYARNVTDQLQIINYSTGDFRYGPANLVAAPAAFPSSGQVTYYTNPPRTFGAELQLRF